jgi:hypothetical protein
MKNAALTLEDRKRTCPDCCTNHGHDLNTAKNLGRRATATALHKAIPTGNGGAYERSQQDAPGQEGKRARVFAHF